MQSSLERKQDGMREGGKSPRREGVRKQWMIRNSEAERFQRFYNYTQAWFERFYLLGLL